MAIEKLMVDANSQFSDVNVFEQLNDAQAKDPMQLIAAFQLHNSDEGQ